MIDVETFRTRVGCFNSGRKRLRGRDGSQKGMAAENLLFSSNFLVLDLEHFCTDVRKVYSPQQFVYPIILYYIYLYFTLLFMLTSCHFIGGGAPLGIWSLSHSLRVGCGLSFLCISYIKIAYFYLIAYVMIRMVNNGLYDDMDILKNFLHRKASRLSRMFTFVVLGLLLLNFLLIGICNPSLLNPGPSCIKVSYQNVQGFYPYPS